MITLSTLSAAYSCNKLKNVKFTADITGTFSVPPQSLTSSTDTLVATNVPTNIQTTLQQNNTSTNLVTSIRLQSLTLTISSPANQTFAFAKNVHILIQAEGQPLIEIASAENISVNGNQLTCNPDNVELKPYIINNNFDITIIDENGQAIATAITVSFDMKFQFTADLLNV
jgi:hypothetical protein